ncbi:unnamed protein product [Discosporangium mesarthrocarpum]
MPTLGHMALVGLVKAGLVNAIVSQNVDGLHLRSGIPRSKLCEVHGNLFMEHCTKAQCGEEVVRTTDLGGVGFKPTGRFCRKCGSSMVDTLLDFNDELRDLDAAQEHSHRCSVAGGLALCLGTSLQMAPSMDFPCEANKMVIVNLQATRKDKRATLVMRTTIDKVMKSLMEKLALPIPVYHRTEKVFVRHTSIEEKGTKKRWTLSVGDEDGVCSGFISTVKVEFLDSNLKPTSLTRPFCLSRVTSLKVQSPVMRVRLVLVFTAAPGHPAPPPKTIDHYSIDLSQNSGVMEISADLGKVDYNMYNPFLR